MVQTRESVYAGGIMPIFSSWAILREDNSQEKKCSLTNEINDVKAFLWQMGFVDSTGYILRFMATVIAKRHREELHCNLSQEYREYAKCKSPDALRMQCKYYILKNLDAMNQKTEQYFGIALFGNNKNFIETLAELYSYWKGKHCK